MRRTLTVSIVAVLALAVPAALAQEHAQHKALEGQVTVTGEVLDMACYVAHGAQGPDHAACAKRCAKMGQPLGLLTAEGKVYLLYAGHDDAAAFNKTKEFAGSKVRIDGKAASKDGITGIEVQAVQPI